MSRSPAPRVDVAAARAHARLVPVVRSAAKSCLELLGVGAGELSVALVDDDAMRRLNRTHRGEDRPTDVLSFPQSDDPVAATEGLLGDVVIAVPTARRQAAERGAPLESELRTLLVHGILHALGYDHERSPAEARRMLARQRALLARLEARAPGRPAVRRRRARLPSPVGGR